jgi:predicted nucleotidyltransferase
MLRKKIKDYGFGHYSSPLSLGEYQILVSFFPEAKPMTLKEIINGTGLSYEPVYRGVNRLAKDGLVDKETVGRTQQFKIRLNTTHAFGAYTLYCIYKLMDTADDYPTVYRELKQICDERKPMALILFGSYASGNAKKGSDVDFVVIDNQNFHPDLKLPDYENIMNLMESTTGYEINGQYVEYLDFLDALKNNQPFWMEIKHRGVVIDGFNTTYNAFYR